MGDDGGMRDISATNGDADRRPPAPRDPVSRETTSGSAAPDEAASADAPSDTGGSSLPGYSLTDVLLHGPVLIAQGRQVQRDVPRLPGAAGREGVTSTICEHHAERDGHEPHLVVLGDSVADGVGIEHHRDSIAGRLACRMSERFEHPVAWHVIARSGADAHDVSLLAGTDAVRSELARADAVVVSVGINDVKNLRTEDAWRTSLRTLLDTITEVNPLVQVVVLGVPPIQEFPSMPTFLGHTLGERALRFDAVAADVIATYPNVQHYLLTDSGLLEKGKAFAEDGFHPSAWLHRKLAKRLDTLIAEPKRPTDTHLLTEAS